MLSKAGSLPEIRCVWAPISLLPGPTATEIGMRGEGVGSDGELENTNTDTWVDWKGCRQNTQPMLGEEETGAVPNSWL